VITQDLADRIEYLTRRAVKAFDRMVEAQLVFGLTHYRYYNARNAYERELEKPGQGHDRSGRGARRPVQGKSTSAWLKA
jgi:hypothetical protein